jgi:hypothetical protein
MHVYLTVAITLRHNLPGVSGRWIPRERGDQSLRVVYKSLGGRAFLFYPTTSLSHVSPTGTYRQ